MHNLATVLAAGLKLALGTISMVAVANGLLNTAIVYMLALFVSTFILDLIADNLASKHHKPAPHLHK
jgi:hypothetical protein